MTTRVALIVTGEMERLALGRSLQRAFRGVDVEWVRPYRTDGFTSAALPQAPVLRGPRGAESAVLKLATFLVAAADPGRADVPADLAIAVEDLELCNRDRPERVVRWMRDAVEQALHDGWSRTGRMERCRERVRQRCSFHLFSSMTEAYFFGEEDALRRAGARRAARVDPTRDLEAFETHDPDYLDPAVRHEQVDPAHHPKAYLRFLCAPGPYRETRGGVAALEALDWSRVTRHRERVRFVRALFADIADGLGVTNPFPGDVHPLTRRCECGLMRNVR